MVIKNIIGAVCACLAIASTNVNATTITFEELGVKTCCFSSEPPLDTQYSAQGVTFDGGWEVLNESGNFGVDALSGSHFLAYSTSFISNTVGMTFGSDINSISGYLGSRNSSTWTISVFLDGVNTYQTSVVNLKNEYINFSLASITADYVTISGSSTNGVLEDLSYSASVVPVPAAAWLFGSGLIGLVGIARRKANA